MKSTLLKLITTALVGAALLFALAPTAKTSAAPSGMTINVNDTADLTDANPGDGKCQAANGGCTLRAAIMEANAHSGLDVINLQPNTLYKLTRAGNDDTAAKGDLDIAEAVHLNGNGATVDANGGITNDRAFHLLPPTVYAHNYFQELTITGGKTAGTGGGILNQSLLALVSVKVVNNSAQVSGGGIANDTYLVMSKSTIGQNSCHCPDAARPGGGGLTNHLVAFLYMTTINSNTATNGGGIWHDGEQLALILTTLYANMAHRDGGGLYIRRGDVGLEKVTVALNMADYDYDDAGSGGGIFVESGNVILGHTLLGDNLNVESFLFFGDDCVGKLMSLGYNLLGTTDNCTIASNDNLLNVAPKFDTFANHGGPTKTYSFKAGSPALDAGNPDNCKTPNGFGGPIDQRQHDRIADGNNDDIAVCDIGAFEQNADEYNTNCDSKPGLLNHEFPAHKEKIKSGSQVLLSFSANCAETYKVAVRRDSPTGKKADKAKGLTFGGYLTKSLEPGHKYYWRVKACNPHGCIRTDWRWFKLK